MGKQKTEAHSQQSQERVTASLLQQVGQEGVTEEWGAPRSGKDLGATPADAACGSCSLLVPVKRPSSGDTYETAGKTASRDGCFLTPGVRAAF